MSDDQGERKFVNDVEVRTVSRRRISMTIDSPCPWTLADVREFVDFATASGAAGDDRGVLRHLPRRGPAQPAGRAGQPHAAEGRPVSDELHPSTYLLSQERWTDASTPGGRGPRSPSRRRPSTCES